MSTAVPLKDRKIVVISFLLISVVFILALNFYFFERTQYALIAAVTAGLLPLASDLLFALKKKTLDLGFPILITVVILLSLGHIRTAAIFVALILSGELFKEYIFERVQTSIREISHSLPDTALIKKNTVVQVKISDIHKGDVVVIKSGSRSPVDGRLLARSASFDESVITGESKMIEKKNGDTILAGSINLGDYVEMEALDVSANSTIAQLHQLVVEAQSNNAPLSHFTTRYAEITSAVALLLTVLLFLISHNLLQSLALWIALVPMIFAIIVPVATTVGISLLAKRGILIKNPGALENLTKITTIVFDKTGTLTEGRPEVQEIIVYASLNQNDLLQLAASVEQYSEHELGKSIIKKAQERQLTLQTIIEPHVLKGQGIVATWNKKQILIGNRQLLSEFGVDIISDILNEVQNKEDQGNSAIFVAINKQLEGIIFIADQLRPEAKAAVAKLNLLGLNLVMLTGDNNRVAEKIAAAIGIGTVHAELSPQDKIRFINKYKNNKEKVAMVGDGINDAPALAGANVGIAMGLEGIELALESAGVVLVNNNLMLLPEMIVNSKRIFHIIKADLFIATAIHACAALLVVFNSIGILGSTLVHQFSSVVVLLNTMRLFSIDAGKKKAVTSE